MDKELLQNIIDNLLPSNPRHKEFEKDLKELVVKYTKPIRLSCEEQGLSDEDK
jgi:hypothetical protein